MQCVEHENGTLHRCLWLRLWCRECDGEWEAALSPSSGAALACPRCGCSGRRGGVFVIARAKGVTSRQLPDVGRLRLFAARPAIVRQRGIHWH